MQFTSLLQEARNLRFCDPAIEQAYGEDRMERDATRVRKVVGALIVIAVGVGTILSIVAGSRGVAVPREWFMIRFGVLAPVMVLIWLLAGIDGGQRRMQLVLGAGMAVAVGAFSLEWSVEWVAGIPLRGLWVVPLLALWASAMALPMRMSAVAGMTLGVFAISTAGIASYVTGLDGLAFAIVLIVFGGSGYGIVLMARWREIDNREAFVNRREIRILAQQLRERNDALVQANKLRDAFVEGVLHDIRSPLTTIFLSAGLLRDTPAYSTGGQKELIEGILMSGKHVDTFVSRFLEQRSLDRADSEPAILDVPLDNAIENLVTRARMAAGLKGQRLVSDAPLHGAIVRADELFLDRALSNLLDNAIKYSPRDSTITVRIASDPVTPGRARVSVIDEGPGLSEEEIEMLFKPYARLEKVATGGEHSVGLGLSLVKKWAEAMGGAVGCESELGRGATFWISLPLK